MVFFKRVTKALALRFPGGGGGGGGGGWRHTRFSQGSSFGFQSNTLHTNGSELVLVRNQVTSINVDLIYDADPDIDDRTATGLNDPLGIDLTDNGNSDRFRGLFNQKKFETFVGIEVIVIFDQRSNFFLDNFASLNLVGEALFSSASPVFGFPSFADLTQVKRITATVSNLVGAATTGELVRLDHLSTTSASLIPLPAGAWLFVSGLACLFRVANRRSARRTSETAEIG